LRDYPQLNELVATYGDSLAVIGFPTGQFNNQEPGDDSEILHCLSRVRPGDGFAPAFPLMSKTIVNGNSEHALFTWLKGLCQLPTSFNYGALTWSPITPYDVGWNFEKFLIDRDGRPCKRYAAEVPAADIAADIAAMLQDGCSWTTTPQDCSDVSGASRL